MGPWSCWRNHATCSITNLDFFPIIPKQKCGTICPHVSHNLSKYSLIMVFLLFHAIATFCIRFLTYLIWRLASSFYLASQGTFLYSVSISYVIGTILSLAHAKTNTFHLFLHAHHTCHILPMHLKTRDPCTTILSIPLIFSQYALPSHVKLCD